MDIKPLLEIGQRAALACPERDDPETVYVSRLEDLRPEAMAIAVPLRRGYLLLLREGERVRLQIPIEGATLEFESTVTGQAESKVRLFLIAYPRTWKRVQRRENVRLKVALRVEGRLETETGPEEIRFCTFDISAGGMGLRSPRKLGAGTGLWLFFRIERKRAVRYIKARGEVVRTIGPDKAEGYEYRLGVKFTEIKKADQDFIVGFIFERMIEQKHLV